MKIRLKKKIAENMKREGIIGMEIKIMEQKRKKKERRECEKEKV